MLQRSWCAIYDSICGKKNDLKEIKPISNLPYVLEYDILNVTACIAVVILHVNGGFFGGGDYNSNWWNFSVFIDTAFYWAVPVFFMLTGATLINYRNRYDTVTFLKKRFTRTVIPFLFWSVVSIPMSIWGYSDVYLEKSTVFNLKGIINVILNQKGASIYWFFIPLFAIYLSIPVLSIIPVQNRKRLFGAMIVYSFITCSLLPTLCHVFGFEFNTALQNPLNGGGYIIYVLLGYYIVNYRIDKKTRIYIYLSGILCAGFRIVYMISKYKETGCIDYTYSNYTNFLSVLMSVAVFVWFWYHNWSILKEKSFIKIIKLLSSLSFGVYLIHIYIKICCC